ncbi:MAG: cysteine desulfurase family protein [Planctomycetota bacterium]|jgi:cysteine desulfurase
MIYLDYNASTPVDPRVAAAMIPYITDHHANPSSAHSPGRKIRHAIDRARDQIASMIGAKPDEIVFTSGGTEASNHAIKGTAHTLRDRGRHIIISGIEHPATSMPCRFLEELGYEITAIKPDADGHIDPSHVAYEVRPDTILISVMHANNEVGTIQHIAEIAEIAHEGGIWFHCDAAQTCGKIPVNVQELDVDFLSIAGHKFYAPQGVGALYIRDGISIESLLHGAGHENGRRAGTEAVPAVVGIGEAAALVNEDLSNDGISHCRDRLYARLKEAFDDECMLLGHPDHRLPNTLAIGFKDRIGADILAQCPDICASTGAACHAANRKRSAVLAAMDVPEAFAFGAIRFSTGRFTTESEIDQAIQSLIPAIRNKREQSLPSS